MNARSASEPQRRYTHDVRAGASYLWDVGGRMAAVVILDLFEDLLELYTPCA